MTTFQFDAAFYDRFYRHPKTRVTDEATIRRLGTFVCSYLKYLRVQVRRVLDIGCGLGWWQKVINDQFPAARYVGVEISDYLCETHGWTKGSIVNFVADEPFDLVICQGVFQYLTDQQAEAALANLARLSRHAVYLEILTQEDWDETVDQTATDQDCCLRPADWYRQRMQTSFTNAGGGLFFTRQSDVVFFALERLTF